MISWKNTSFSAPDSKTVHSPGTMDRQLFFILIEYAGELCIIALRELNTEKHIHTLNATQPTQPLTQGFQLC